MIPIVRRQLVTAICLLTFAGYQAVPAQVRDDLVSRLENIALLIQNEKLDEAERQLSLVLRRNADQPDALNLFGALRAKQRRYAEAEKLFSRAVNANANLVSARMNLAQLYLIQAKPEAAISELNQVLRLQPENIEAFSLLLSLGDAYLQKKNAAKAEEVFRLALERQGDDADAILGMAQVAQLRGDATSASAYLDQAKRATVKSADTLRKFALVAWEAGRFEEANQALTEAIKLKPGEPALHVALGTTWLKKPDLIEAEQAFRRALQLQSDNPEAQMYLGYTLMLQGKYPEARELLEKSLAKQSTVPQTFYYLGLISQEEGDDQAAIRHFKKTLQLLPSYAEVHGALGRSYLNLKDYPQAQAELELAVKLNPNDTQAHYQLAVLYARLKDPERAKQQMQIVEALKEAAKAPRKPNP